MVLLPWLSYQSIGWSAKKIFLVISEEDSICPVCGSPLCKRDKRQRIYKEAGGIKKWFIINRLKCTNNKCRIHHNELPDCIIPYKHYGTEIIEDVIDEVIGPEDIGVEDYPCEGTMKHWKWWLRHNEKNIDGQMRSMMHHLLGLDDEFLRSGESLLKGLRERISPGWLSVVIRFIYNAGGRIEPYPA